MNSTSKAGAALIGCMLIAGCASQTSVTKEASNAPVPTTKAAATTPTATPALPSTPVATAAPAPAVGDTATASATQAEQQRAALAADSSLAAVYYAFDSAQLDAVARGTLQKDFTLLQGKRVRIEGHCDERGSDEYNMALGEKRAQAAQRYLVTLGVPADRIAVISYGKERPADTGHDESAWAKNRRAELIVSK
jgi:peptidoglycan-associated lipoprotein